MVGPELPKAKRRKVRPMHVPHTALVMAYMSSAHLLCSPLGSPVTEMSLAQVLRRHPHCTQAIDAYGNCVLGADCGYAICMGQVLEHEQMYLEALPNAEMYERSYMHRDTITHVAVAPETDFFITGSVDGHLKFWKKKAEGVEFAKHFRAHLGGVDGALFRVCVCTSAHAQRF